MKRIQKARISLISLCPRGKNACPVLYKADGSVQIDTVLRASEDLGEITAVVYLPETPDKDQHIASADVIRDMAHEFMKAYREDAIDLQHDGKPVSRDRAYIAESFIVQKGDPRFADMKNYQGEAIDVTGSWATVIRLEDPNLRKLYKEGIWNGVSMFGEGVLTVEKEDEEEAPGWFKKFLNFIGLEKREFSAEARREAAEKGQALPDGSFSILSKEDLRNAIQAFGRAKNKAQAAQHIKRRARALGATDLLPKEGQLALRKGDALINIIGELDMTPEQFEKFENLIVTALAKADGEPKKVEQPEIDVNDPVALQKHLDSLEEQVNLNDPESIRKRLAKLQKQAEDSKVDVNDPKALKARIAELEKADKEKAEKLKKAERRSNQDGGADDVAIPEGLSKEDFEAVSLGSKMASYINSQRGYKVDA